MSRILKCVLSAAILFLVPRLAWAQEQLRAGVAKTVITPDVHNNQVYLAGFGHNRIATGVHDDLYARCLALEAAGVSHLIVPVPTCTRGRTPWVFGDPIHCTRE